MKLYKYKINFIKKAHLYSRHHTMQLFLANCNNQHNSQSERSLGNHDDVSRQKKSESRQVVSFMRLFAGEYTLDKAAPDFRDQVHHLGTLANANVQDFFGSLNVVGRSSGSALRVFRKLHCKGALDERIMEHRRLGRIGLIVDSSSDEPLETMNASSCTLYEQS